MNAPTLTGTPTPRDSSEWFDGSTFVQIGGQHAAASLPIVGFGGSPFTEFSDSWTANIKAASGR
jgi:hypothetical protein